MATGWKQYCLYAKTMMQDLDGLRWNIGRPPDVAYVGWLGRGNLGDEAMFLSHRQRLRSDTTLGKAPINGWSRRLASLVRKPKADVLLIGGGTVLGHTGWLKSITEARRLLAPNRFVVLGAGMEDLDFALKKGLASKRSLHEWAAVLNDADYVGVRGPLSQAHLAKLGVDSHVVGDSALWFEGSSHLGDAKIENYRAPYVAINVVGRSTGFDVDALHRRREVLEYAQRLSGQGLQVVLFGMEKQDVQAARVLQKSLPVAQVFPWSRSVARVFNLIQGSELVVAERLHGAILAAAASVPFIMLAYKPKSYDFAQSVNATDSCVEPSDLSAEFLMQCTNSLIGSTMASTTVECAKSALADRFDVAHAKWVVGE